MDVAYFGFQNTFSLQFHFILQGSSQVKCGSLHLTDSSMVISGKQKNQGCWLRAWDLPGSSGLVAIWLMLRSDL